jgi:hypothetical protein
MKSIKERELRDTWTHEHHFFTKRIPILSNSKDSQLKSQVKTKRDINKSLEIDRYSDRVSTSFLKINGLVT